MKGKRISKKTSRAMFKKSTRLHPKNKRPAVMRGGIRR
ncbi:MAG: hypothetical protein [Arizlama microvirus]|nr:MAG: hypothetical protein [Arizlama microvirus]